MISFDAESAAIPVDVDREIFGIEEYDSEDEEDEGDIRRLVVDPIPCPMTIAQMQEFESHVKPIALSDLENINRMAEYVLFAFDRFNEIV